jgi:hypothetical protein
MISVLPQIRRLECGVGVPGKAGRVAEFARRMIASPAVKPEISPNDAIPIVSDVRRDQQIENEHRRQPFG